MSLASDVLAILPRLRAEAEALMVDSCSVGRPADVYTDQTTGQVVTVSTPVYEGPCKVQLSASEAAQPVAGEYQFTVQPIRLDLPVSAGPLMVDDTVTITAAVLDPQMVGRVYRVVELFHKSYATAQRVRAEEVTD